MLPIQKDDFVPRLSVERRRSGALPFSPLLSINGLSRKICSYDKLPQHPLNLSVLKLDGSSFQIEVSKWATVAELKQAVEGVFSHLPKKGPSKISWPHVWGYFCLSYDGQKLVTENEYISDFGIKDGDQLHFIQHASINYNMIKRRSKKWVSLNQRRMSSSRLDSCEERKKNGEEDSDCDGQENGGHKHYNERDKDLTRQHECRLAHFLRGWFSYSKLATVGKTRFKGKDPPLRFTSSFVSSVRKVMQLYSNKPYSQRDRRRKD